MCCSFVFPRLLHVVPRCMEHLHFKPFDRFPFHPVFGRTKKGSILQTRVHRVMFGRSSRVRESDVLQSCCDRKEPQQNADSTVHRPFLIDEFLQMLFWCFSMRFTGHCYTFCLFAFSGCAGAVLLTGVTGANCPGGLASPYESRRTVGSAV